MTNRLCRMLSGVLFTLSAGYAGPALAVDVQPKDWVPAPDGTSAVALYWLMGKNDGISLNGERIEASLDSQILVPRGVHYFEFSDRPAALSVVMPFGRLSGGSIAGADLPDASGLANITVSAASWFVNNPEKQQYMALAAYLTIPTGEYRPDRVLNLGTDRFSVALQLGGHTALTDKLSFEGTLDIEIFASNDNANAAGQTLEQDPAYSLQTWLSYQVDPTLTLSAGYANYKGGEQKLDGMETGFKSDRQQARLGVTKWINPTLSVYGQINHDFDVDGGFRQDTSAVFRIAKFF